MKQKMSTRITFWIVAALFVLLLVLMFSTITAVLQSSSVRTSVPFDLDSITAGKSTVNVDISDTLVPAFIGFSADGTLTGASVSANTLAELYRTVTPVLAEVLADADVTNGNARTWDSLTSATNFVYIRYHSELPDTVIQNLASPDGTPKQSLTAYVSELILLPYAESTDTITAATRSTTGSVTVFTHTSPEAVLTAADLRSTVRSYRSALTAFAFDETSGEPVFQSSVATRTIIMTEGTATLVQNSELETESLLRLFGLNPDKLLNRHIEPDGTGSYIDAHGILYLENSSFSYTALEDGGISVADILESADAAANLPNLIRACIRLIDEVRQINHHFTGGDADILLSGITSDDGIVTLTFEYTFDNLRFTGIEPAFTATFDNGILQTARLYTMAVRNLGQRTENLAEWWILDTLRRENTAPDDVTLVYRSDFLSESVAAEWTGTIRKGG